MPAQLCRVLTNIGRADQQLERPGEPAAPADKYQIANPAAAPVSFPPGSIRDTEPSFLLSLWSQNYSELIPLKAACHLTGPF